MTVGEVITELQKVNPNLLIRSLAVVRDEDGEHVSFSLETMPSTEAQHGRLEDVKKAP